MNPDSDIAGEALRIGASGYLLKNSHNLREIANLLSFIDLACFSHVRFAQ